MNSEDVVWLDIYTKKHCHLERLDNMYGASLQKKNNMQPESTTLLQAVFVETNTRSWWLAMRLQSKVYWDTILFITWVID